MENKIKKDSVYIVDVKGIEKFSFFFISDREKNVLLYDDTKV